MQYIIRKDEPFQGHVQSIVNPDGTIAYCAGLTLETYEAERGFPIRVIDDAELDQLTAEHLRGLVSDPAPITQERFWEMLEVLPPCHWHNAGGFEVFHVSERLTHNLVSWFAHRGDSYWEFTDHDNITDTDLVTKLQAV